MSANDIQVIAMPASTREFKVDDRDTSTTYRTIKAGEPVVECTNYVVRIKDDDPQIDVANEALVGVAASESTETAGANGTVEVTMLIPCVTVLRGQPYATTSVDTESELLAYLNDTVSFYCSQTPYSSTEADIKIDESDEDSTTNGLIIIGGAGDKRAYLDVIVRARNMFGGNIA